jgi:hypothetical protein
MAPSTELERQRAWRAILQKPLLTSFGADAETYRLIRTHAQWLKDWFARNAEWTLQTTPNWHGFGRPRPISKMTRIREKV